MAEPKTIDIAIIGSGPAGISAALTATARGRSFLLFGSRALSPRLAKAHQINNYPGLTGTGAEITAAFLKQLDEQHIPITEKRITNIFPMGKQFSLLSGQEQFDTKTVILATGTDFGKALDGEEQFLGRGVSYCATCDGMLYKGKTVAVVSYSADEEHEANFLAGICNKVYYLPQYKTTPAVDARCEIITAAPASITGALKAQSLLLDNGTTLNTDCIFILRKSIAPSALIPGIKTDANKIIVDRTQATNIPGCYAAGDITGAPFQIAKAVGEGNIAAQSADSFISAK